MQGCIIPGSPRGWPVLDASQEVSEVSGEDKTWTWVHKPPSTRRLCCEKLGTSHDVKGFAIGSFLERIVVERANDDLC